VELLLTFLNNKLRDPIVYGAHSGAIQEPLKPLSYHPLPGFEDTFFVSVFELPNRLPTTCANRFAFRVFEWLDLTQREGMLLFASKPNSQD